MEIMAYPQRKVALLCMHPWFVIILAGSFPIGGSSQIVETIDPVIEKAGGTILINAEVDKVIIENNKAIGVQMTDGKSFYAKNIISGAGIMTTYKKLLPDIVKGKHRLEEQLKNVQRSVSHACLYIGLKGSPEELKLPQNQSLDLS